MRINNTVVEEIERVKIKSIICNCCGKESESELPEFEDFENVQINFGFGSRYDGDSWTMDLCTPCLMNFFKTFKHKPTVTGI